METFKTNKKSSIPVSLGFMASLWKHCISALSNHTSQQFSNEFSFFVHCETQQICEVN